MVKNVLNRFKQKKYFMFSLIFSVVFVLDFCLFSISNKTFDNSVSNDISTISKASTTNSANFDILCNKTSVSINEINSEIQYLNDINSMNTAGSLFSSRIVYNSKFSTYITLDDLEDESYSVLPHYTSGSPHQNALGEYVHSSFELKLMFGKNQNNTSWRNRTSFVYIQKYTADKLLDHLSKKHTQDNYLMLLKTFDLNVTYRYAGFNKNYKLDIANIILPNEGDDPFYEKTFGHYMTICTYNYYENCMPSFDGYSINTDFGTSTYDNRNYLKLLRTRYSGDEYEFRLNTYNLKKNLNETYINEVLTNAKTSPNKMPDLFVFLIIIIVMVVALVFSFLLLKQFTSYNEILNSVFFVFITYLLLYSLFYFLTKFLFIPTIFLSSSASLLYFLFVVFFILECIFCFNAQKRKNSNKFLEINL